MGFNLGFKGLNKLLSIHDVYETPTMELKRRIKDSSL